MGSCFQLYSYVTDTELPEMRNTEAGARSLLADCESCGIRAGMCPTGVIIKESEGAYSINGRVILKTDPLSFLAQQEICRFLFPVSDNIFMIILEYLCD